MTRKDCMRTWVYPPYSTTPCSKCQYNSKDEYDNCFYCSATAEQIKEVNKEYLNSKNRGVTC